ncbi:MAG: aminotransferase class V-fold PLP-dependent enzyme, partial [Acidiferrobacteraceae bacterium]|nr:aminotransferase class V-fold PLP-dependent enzyme [Acidiferrobacteraceae bacterium]
MNSAALNQNPPALDAYALRADFPALAQQINDHPLVYLDNGATTQKPQAVIDAVADFYSHDNAN